MSEEKNDYDNLKGDIDPIKVRDAVVDCFYKAHCADSQIVEDGDEQGKKGYCQEIVRKAFADSGGNFDRPTKESIIASLEKLKEFAINFRSKEIIQKHYQQMMDLVNKL